MATKLYTPSISNIPSINSQQAKRNVNQSLTLGPNELDQQNERYVSHIDQAQPKNAKRVPISLNQKNMHMRLNVSSQHELKLK